MGLFARDEPAPEIKTSQPPRKTGASPAAGSENRTVIARPTRIEGRVLGSGEILVDGMIKGIIDSDGKVRVAENGRVEADVHARLVAVAGPSPATSRPTNESSSNPRRRSMATSQRPAS